MARSFQPPQWQLAPEARTCPECHRAIAPRTMLLIWPGSPRFVCAECGAWFAPNYAATVETAQRAGQW